MTVVLKVWLLTEQQQYDLRTCWKYRFWASPRSTQSKTFKGGSSICVLVSPRDYDIC